MKVLDLFSGIGGFSLGLERAGMTTLAFCEIDPYARAVLDARWPGVFCFEDVRTLSAELLDVLGIDRPDLICGGFPCQDISLAGKGAGLAGERSGLFYEIARLAGEIRPRWLLLENVAALRSRGLDAVLRELAALGYDAQWHLIPASALGAPHRRDRIWIVANAGGGRCGRAEGDDLPASALGAPHRRDRVWIVAHAAGERRDRREGDQERREPHREAAGRPQGDDGPWAGGQGRGTGIVAHAYSNGSQGTQPAGSEASERRRLADAGQEDGAAQSLSDAYSARLAFWEGFRRHLQREIEAAQRAHRAFGWWRLEPPVGRVAHGVPARVDRLRALGNAVVPQIPEILGRAIMATEAGRCAP